MEELIRSLESGARHALARVISKIENREADADALVDSIFLKTKDEATIWGVTGPPGAGKSTLTDQLIRQLRARGEKVAVVAVDPSSPFSGGAILGDRIRMKEHHEDSGVYIRSLGTRGIQGGLSRATQEVCWALELAGFKRIIVETAGVGQTELGILKLAHSVCVVLVPESGDSIQMMKAGLMEIADLFVINKSDRPGAEKLAKDLLLMMGLKDHDAQTWFPPVVKTQATDGVGLPELMDAFQRHEERLKSTGGRAKRDETALKEEVSHLLREWLEDSIRGQFQSQGGRDLLSELKQRKMTPAQVAKMFSGTR